MNHGNAVQSPRNEHVSKKLMALNKYVSEICGLHLESARVTQLTNNSLEWVELLEINAVRDRLKRCESGRARCFSPTNSNFQFWTFD